jgi:hypothetical protein
MQYAVTCNTSLLISAEFCQLFNCCNDASLAVICILGAWVSSNPYTQDSTSTHMQVTVFVNTVSNRLLGKIKLLSPTLGSYLVSIDLVTLTLTVRLVDKLLARMYVTPM